MLFIFSGWVKLNDPQGTAIKMEEYFEVFSSDISGFFHYLVPYAMVAGLLIIILEILLGFALLINYRMKITVWILLIIIVFFTFLTFYSAAFNKVTDCGCFGDAIPFTPWQSFTKDVILLILIIFLFIRSRENKLLLSVRSANIAMAAVLSACISLAYYAIEHLPLVDFRPYKIGADIRASMQPSEPYEYLYIMERDGDEYEFDTYPTDTTYQFVEMKLLNPEAEPKITDYNVWTEDGDYTEESLSGTKLLVLFNDVTKSRFEKTGKITELTNSVSGDGVEAWVLTANDEATFENFRHEYQLSLPYYHADGTVIKAMIRANPGLILLKDGIVLGKWHSNDIPTREELMELVESA